MKLVIAEKPSVAMAIAKVLGAKKRFDGYYEGENYRVSWCVGHLVRLSSPERYNTKYKYWKIEDLPILPKVFLYEVNPSTKKQFQILKKLMNAKDLEGVVNACDAGREGELIFRLVYQEVGCRKKIERLWISSMEDQAILEGFHNLKDGKDYQNLYESALARQWADWLVGMNGSRYYSKKYDKTYSVGRVQTPTLALLVDRAHAIQSFKKEKYYTVDIQSGEIKLVSPRIDALSVAEGVRDSLSDFLEVSALRREKKVTRPDKLYDLTTLQREANKCFGFSAKQTLDYAQSLYEKKYITYPRTDSRYLTEDMEASTSSLMEAIEPNLEREASNFQSLFNSKKVSDHHAIIPTPTSVEYYQLDLMDSEKRLYLLIMYKFLASCMENLVEEIVKVEATDGENIFYAKGKTTLQKGFTELLEKEKFSCLKGKETGDISLPFLQEGDKIPIEKVLLAEKYTKPPLPYTEDTLLKAMETAGKDAIEKGMDVERKGLGTPATRAGILENLIAKKLVRRDKKNLIPTEDGQALIAVVAESLRSAQWTAEWEMKLYRIAQGEFSKENFIHGIEAMITQLVTAQGKEAVRHASE